MRNLFATARTLLPALAILAWVQAAYDATLFRIVAARTAVPCTDGALVAEPQCEGCAEARHVDWHLRDGIAARQSAAVPLSPHAETTARSRWSSLPTISSAPRAAACAR